MPIGVKKGREIKPRIHPLITVLTHSLETIFLSGYLRMSVLTIGKLVRISSNLREKGQNVNDLKDLALKAHI